MNENVKIVELVIDEETGVDAVALVDRPAIEREWLAFNEEGTYKFKVENEERRIVSGPLMVADLPIYRVDQYGGEYYAIFRKDTIEKIVHKFMQEGRTNAVNLMHESSMIPEGVYMFESFIIDSSRGINTPDGFKALPDGSWFSSYKVENDEVWQQVKEGTFKGFSVEGMFKPLDKGEKPTDLVDAIIEIINGK